MLVLCRTPSVLALTLGAVPHGDCGIGSVNKSVRRGLEIRNKLTDREYFFFHFHLWSFVNVQDHSG